jgi:F0F1-type ATP synthase alpha subunit
LEQVLLVFTRLSNVLWWLVEFENGLETIVLNLEEDNVGVVLLGPSRESRRIYCKNTTYCFS